MECPMDFPTGQTNPLIWRHPMPWLIIGKPRKWRAFWAFWAWSGQAFLQFWPLMTHKITKTYQDLGHTFSFAYVIIWWFPKIWVPQIIHSAFGFSWNKPSSYWVPHDYGNAICHHMSSHFSVPATHWYHLAWQVSWLSHLCQVGVSGKLSWQQNLWRSSELMSRKSWGNLVNNSWSYSWMTAPRSRGTCTVLE